MIVKNEKHCIARALKSAIPFITHYCIHDTGSTDKTKEIIAETMAVAGIPGKIVDEPWVNFAENRSKSLASARELCPTGWAWVLDADDTIEGTAPPTSFWETVPANVNALRLRIHHGSLKHHRTQIFSCRSKWVYKGAVHEWPACEGSAEVHALMPESVWHHARCEGSRSNDTLKYVRDAFALRAELAKTPDEPRSCFYLAQSFRDAGLNEEAIKAYKHRATLSTGWMQEAYMSYVNLIKLAPDFEQKLEYAWKAVELDQHRLEAPYAILYAARTMNKFSQEVYALGIVTENRTPHDYFLFPEPHIYDYAFDDELSIIAYWKGHYKVSAAAALRAKDRCPPHMLPRVQMNVDFAMAKLRPAPAITQVAAPAPAQA
jgi:glycosyltransferase involved in cell wall biosynthesis